MINKKLLFLAFLLVATTATVFNGCDKDKDDENVIKISPSADDQSAVQAALINVTNGQIIELQAGTFNFISTLSVDAKTNFTLRGVGQDETILNFANQTAGAEGIIATNMSNVLFSDFTIKETPGDAIKVKDSHGVTFCDMATIWESVADSTNGAYGLYPVTCTSVLIDGCYAKGASDAGIYVGQSDTVIVSNTEAEGNVAGIEIENTSNADVYGNYAHDNTGGILVFDLPNLPKKNGGVVRVFDNNVVSNDGANFAPPGNMVANVPVGTGLMLMSADNVEIYENTFTNNNLGAVMLVSYEVFVYLNPAFGYTDPLYSPFTWAVNLHNNTFSRTNQLPATNNAIGTLIALQFQNGDIPDILYDGITNGNFQADDAKRICITNNGTAKFCNLDAENFFATKLYDLAPYNCQRTALTPITVKAPECK